MRQRLFKTLLTFILGNIAFAQEPKLVLPLERSSLFFSTSFSPDGEKIAVCSHTNKTPKILSPSSRNPFIILRGHTQITVSAEFSRDNKKIVTTSMDSTARIWDTESGALLWVLRGHKRGLMYAEFSREDKRIVTASDDGTVKVWEWDGMKWRSIVTVLKDSKVQAYSASFNQDGTKIVTGSNDDTVRIWDVATGHLDKKLIGHKEASGTISVKYSPDGTKVVSGSSDSSAIIWNAQTGKPIKYLLGHKASIYTAHFSKDGKKIISASNDGTAKVWDAAEGKLIQDIIGHTDQVKSARYSPDGTRIITSSYDHTIKVWDAVSTKCLYTFYAVDSTDYLVVDNESHYDGTEAARRLLYFTCGTDTVDLSQVKDQLWVPKLSERINNGEKINAKSLNDLNVCGLTPIVEDVSKKENDYHFTIKPRRGGLGETVLYINGIEAKRYKSDQLINNNGIYDLVIPKADLKLFFIPGEENPVMVKAWTADNSISSRGAELSVTDTSLAKLPPNLYAVMVGVSDYKGTEMDLKYADKDATDISALISNTAKKLLNATGGEHVFMYNLTTAKERYQLPEKNSIKKVFEEISKKATANDILLIFFAGHGVTAGEGDKKQFYFLTSDASTLASTDAVKEVGISTAELTEWMKPSNIKAQKRILIFDACNSGQAINDITGNDLAVRDDSKAQQIKAIDKLNEKSGLFILSASASNQSAYEMGRYSQGLLTYSLLKAIKQKPDILNDGKYLDISKWFNAAKESVADLAKESGARQEPQIVTNTNFNIGLVDGEVMAKIILPQEKPLFASSNFQNNDDAVADDDLELSKLINLQLADISSRGSESKIVYITTTNSPDAYSLSGRYIIRGNDITLTVNIKQNKTILSKFVQKGTKDKINELAAAVAEKAAGMVK